MGEIYEMEKNFEKALDNYKKLYKSSKEKQPALLKIAKCFKKIGQLENAIKSYEQALTFDTKNYIPYYKLGWM